MIKIERDIENNIVHGYKNKIWKHPKFGGTWKKHEIDTVDLILMTCTILSNYL